MDLIDLGGGSDLPKETLASELKTQQLNQPLMTPMEERNQDLQKMEMQEARKLKKKSNIPDLGMALHLRDRKGYLEELKTGRIRSDKQNFEPQKTHKTEQEATLIPDVGLALNPEFPHSVVSGPKAMFTSDKNIFTKK